MGAAMWVVAGLLVGLALGVGLMAVVVKNGWFSIGLAAKDATQQLSLLVQGLHVVRGKRGDVPCPRCGFVFGLNGSEQEPPSQGVAS